MDFNNFYGMPGGAFMNPMQTQENPMNYCQTLTVDEANAIKQLAEEFTLGISKHDQLRAICMHRDPSTGLSMLDYNEVDDEVTCKICGKKFHIFDNLTEDDVKAATDNLLDILQSTKTMYMDMPAEVAKNFYQIIAMIEKIPGLYKMSVDNLNKHEKATGFANSNGPSMVNAFNALVSGYPMYGGMNMGMGMPGMGMPVYNPQMQANYYGAPTQPGGNPFGANGPVQQPGMMPNAAMPQQQMGYAPQMMNYAYSPNQATAAATVAGAAGAMPQAGQVPPASQQVTTDGSNVQVDQQFKV